MLTLDNKTMLRWGNLWCCECLTLTLDNKKDNVEVGEIITLENNIIKRKVQTEKLLLCTCEAVPSCPRFTQ